MRFVLYNIDLEPITVLEMPIEVYDNMIKQGFANINIKSPDSHATVLFQVKLIQWMGCEKPIIYTRSEEECLGIEPAVLPGQQVIVSRFQQTINKWKKRFKSLDGDMS